MKVYRGKERIEREGTSSKQRVNKYLTFTWAVSVYGVDGGVTLDKVKSCCVGTTTTGQTNN